jgi:hypothetical protein
MYSFSLGADSTPGPWCTVGRNMSLKNPVTPPGIDPGKFRLVAQHLNHYATPGPLTNQVTLLMLLALAVLYAIFSRPLAPVEQSYQYRYLCH